MKNVMKNVRTSQKNVSMLLRKVIISFCPFLMFSLLIFIWRTTNATACFVHTHKQIHNLDCKIFMDCNCPNEKYPYHDSSNFTSYCTPADLSKFLNNRAGKFVEQKSIFTRANGGKQPNLETSLTGAPLGKDSGKRVSNTHRY